MGEPAPHLRGYHWGHGFFGWCSGFPCGVASSPWLYWSLASSYLLLLPDDFPTPSKLPAFGSPLQGQRLHQEPLHQPQSLLGQCLSWTLWEWIQDGFVGHTTACSGALVQAGDYSEGLGNKEDCLCVHTDVSSVAKGTLRTHCFISQVAKSTEPRVSFVLRRLERWGGAGRRQRWSMRSAGEARIRMQVAAERRPNTTRGR